MNQNDDESGRTPPPAQYKFLKGTSGNERGRPKGAVSTKRLTRKVAGQRIWTETEGKKERKTIFELIINKLKHLKAAGHPGAMLLHDYYSNLARPPIQENKGGLLVVPQTATPEEWFKMQEEHNRHAREPGTYVNHAAEEFVKAVRGEYSPYGHARLAYLRKWGGLK